jgi:hypothetical protein
MFRDGSSTVPSKKPHPSERYRISPFFVRHAGKARVMQDYELAALEASVGLTYGCAPHLVDRTPVIDGDSGVRIVLTYELGGPHSGRSCFAWNEPNAKGQPRIVLQSAENRTPQEAVRAVVHGWDNGTSVPKPSARLDRDSG